MTSRSVMVGPMLIIISEFDSNWVPHTSDLVPNKALLSEW